MLNLSVENTLLLVSISDSSYKLVRYSYAKTTQVFSTDRLSTCLFLLYYHTLKTEYWCETKILQQIITSRKYL